VDPLPREETSEDDDGFDGFLQKDHGIDQVDGEMEDKAPDERTGDADHPD